MKYVGFIICMIGIALLAFAFTMDTSISVDYPGGNSFGLPDRVNNLGLMQDKQNYMILGAVLTVIGFITIYSYDKKKD